MIFCHYWLFSILYVFVQPYRKSFPVNSNLKTFEIVFWRDGFVCLMSGFFKFLKRKYMSSKVVKIRLLLCRDIPIDHVLYNIDIWFTVMSHVWPLFSHGSWRINWNWTQIKLNSSLLGTNDSRANTSLCFLLNSSAKSARNLGVIFLQKFYLLLTYISSL